jgi:hypothetical protein
MTDYKSMPKLDEWLARIVAKGPEQLTTRARRRPPDAPQLSLFETLPMSRGETMAKLIDEELERRRRPAAGGDE